MLRLSQSEFVFSVLSSDDNTFLICSNTNIMPDLLPNDCPPNKRSSKKRNSKKKNDQENVNEMPLEVKNLSTGLVIQELAKGDPSGKLAVRGKKVSLCQFNMWFVHIDFG